MPVSPSASANNDYSANLRKLVGGRWLVLAVLAVLTLGVPSTLAIPLPQLPLLASLGIAALFNGYIHWQTQRNSQASAHELFSHLLFRRTSGVIKQSYIGVTRLMIKDRGKAVYG